MRPIIRMHAYDYDRSTAHSDQWQELELILCRLLQHRNMRERREGSSVCVTYTSGNFKACMYETHGRCMFSFTRMCKQSSADCCRRSKVFTPREDELGTISISVFALAGVPAQKHPQTTHVPQARPGNGNGEWVVGGCAKGVLARPPFPLTPLC